MSRIRRALIVAGLSFGDEGKGSVVDWLVRAHHARTVVRYNGGAQAAHHVVTSDGRTHCFAQLGAGTLVPGVRTFLSRFVIVDPLALAAEERALRAIGVTDAYARLRIDPACVLVTPFHRIINQMRELARGPARHGSCGMGIAEARLDSERGNPVVRAGDMTDPPRLEKQLKLIWLSKLDQAEQLLDAHPDVPGLAGALADLSRRDRVAGLVEAYRGVLASGVTLGDAPAPAGTVVFEGAQGVLLDRELGFWPYVTPSETTFAHAHTLIEEWGGAGACERWGVLRAYTTRHGAGPLPTEDPALGARLPDAHNREHPWQGRFRVGWFDAVAARYALRAAGGVDHLLISNLDRLASLERVRICTAYEDEAGLLRDIPPAGGETARSARTRRLMTCRPRYQERPSWPEPGLSRAALDYIHALQADDALGWPVSAVSLGPRAEDKQHLG